MENKLEIGDLAPNIILQNQDNKKINIADIYTKKIIFFYPKDNTPGCTKEAVGFSDLEQEFSKKKCKVYGVSKDSYQKHTNFIKKYSLKTELLSDPDGAICIAFGVWKEKNMYGKKYMGIERTTFLLDEKNCIINIWNKVKVKYHAKDILFFLET